MGAITINLTGLILGFVLLVIPTIIDYWLKLGLIRHAYWSIFRMSIQLLAVGLILEHLFELNSAWINLAWLGLMIFAAIFATAGRLKVKLSIVFVPIAISFLIATLPILLYFQKFILKLDNLLDARYLIALGGMILGTVLTTNIIALNSFYQHIVNNSKEYLYRLALGASLMEALLPFMRESFRLALLPTLAKTATMGIVAIPGMMTGQILSGSSPLTAISYQIMIMIAIYVGDVISILLTIGLSIRQCFDAYGIIKPTVFKNNS